MNHVEIGHNDSGNDERCPLCRMTDERDELREALQNIVDAMSKGSEEYPDRLETTNRYVEAVNILAKYPKP
jgi:hypothetical protein